MMRFIVPKATSPVTAAAVKAGRAMISLTRAPPRLRGGGGGRRVKVRSTMQAMGSSAKAR
jgi:hypothetical protein